MSFDESDDAKKRRNLIVFSTAIIAVTWLNISPIGIFIALTKDSLGTSIDPARAWIAIFFMMIYFIYQYIFCESYKKIKTEMTEEKYKKMQGDVYNALDREIKAIGYSKLKEIKKIKLLDDDIASIQENFAKNNTNFKRLTIRHGSIIWSGIVEFQLKSSTPHNDRIIKEYSCRYAIKDYSKTLIEIKYTFLILINSKFTSEFYVPHGLTGTSMIIIIYKLNTLALASYTII